jgi:hypothetical protein
MGNAGHLDFDRHGDLALDLFGAAARTGRLRKLTMPQAVSTTTPPRTSQRFLSAKSTSARII